MNFPLNMTDRITSTSNPRIREAMLLQQKSSERRSKNLIVIEGLREIQLAVRAGCTIKTLFFCPEIIQQKGSELQICPDPEKRVEIAPNVFKKLAYRDSSDGLIALAVPKTYTLKDMEGKEKPLFIILEAIEKPGNLGAVLRTADAAKVDAVIVCEPLADIYNPNTIRSSVGCVFTVPVVACESVQAIKWLRENAILIMAAELSAAHSYHETDMKGPLALVLGTESTGLTQLWLDAADKNIKIPMLGEIDSLNVSVSTAILVFEAMRQRGFI